MDPTFNFSVSFPESRRKLCKRGRETHAGLARFIYFVAFRAKRRQSQSLAVSQAKI